MNQWEVLKILGSGGMAWVFKVWSKVERRDYAMKVLAESFAKDPIALARFEREFCTLKRLSHPHIVKVDSFVAAKGKDPCFYTMELLEGESLDTIAKRGRLPVERAVQIALQICDAVGALHDLGVLHRDVKPANIIVGRKDGRDHATLVDFGVCKWTPAYYAELDGRTPLGTRRKTKAGVMLGTPGYMGASEDDDDGEFRDVFGLAATLFRAVTGRMPYAGEPAPDEAIQWRDDEAQLPGTLKEALEGALEASVSSRYQSIVEFRESLVLVVDELKRRPVVDVAVAPELNVGPTRVLHRRIGADAHAAQARSGSSPRRTLVLSAVGLGLGLLSTGIGIGISISAGDDDGCRSRDAGQPGPNVAEEHSEATVSPPHGPGDDDPPHGPGPDELRLSNAMNCVPPTSGADVFVDLQIDDDGRLAGVQPGEGVGALTVLCLKKKLEGTRIWPGGQSTHRVLLSSLLAREGEHDGE